MHHAIGTGRFGIAKHATGKMARFHSIKVPQSAHNPSLQSWTP